MIHILFGEGLYSVARRWLWRESLYMRAALVFVHEVEKIISF